MRLLSIFAIALLVSACSLEKLDNEATQKITIIESFEDDTLESGAHRFGITSDFMECEYIYDETYGSWAGFAYSKCFDMEDSSYDNQYSVYNNGAASGNSFAAYYYDSYNDPTDIRFRYHGNYVLNSICLNLSTITYKTVTEGNAFARAFDEGDYLKVSFIALNGNYEEGESLDFYAVDYRNGKRFIADNWSHIDLSSLNGALWGLRIRIETTDIGEWGANTPLYICLDDFTYSVTL